MPPAALPAQAREHLEKVLRSVTFSRADQLRRLLEWLGTRSLEPGSAPPSEKEIAEAVLRRRDFDPQADSLVRKEMSRLREKLDRYYKTEGSRDAVRIEASNGYRPQFVWQGGAGGGQTRQLCLLVLPFRLLQTDDEQLSRFLDELYAQLGESAPFELIAPTTALGYAGRRGDVREFASECGADLVAEGTLQRRGDRIEAILWLVDGRTGRTHRPGRFTELDSERLAQSAVRWLLERIEQPGS